MTKGSFFANCGMASKDVLKRIYIIYSKKSKLYCSYYSADRNYTQLLQVYVWYGLNLKQTYKL